MCTLSEVGNLNVYMVGVGSFNVYMVRGGQP